MEAKKTVWKDSTDNVSWRYKKGTGALSDASEESQPMYLLANICLSSKAEKQRQTEYVQTIYVRRSTTTEFSSTAGVVFGNEEECFI